MSRKGEEFVNRIYGWLDRLWKGAFLISFGLYITGYTAADGLDRYGLAWNPSKVGHVLGASEDMTICHW